VQPPEHLVTRLAVRSRDAGEREFGGQ
jgi:hypothetical protein